jgi:hypothetical protein
MQFVNSPTAHSPGRPYSAPLAAVLWFWVSLAPALPSTSQADSPLRLSFEGDAVVISDLDLGEVALFWVYRYSEGLVPRTVRRAERGLFDDDKDGQIRVDLERPVPPKFVAVAVELSSGGGLRYGVLTPEGSPAREVALPATSLLEGPGNRLDGLEEKRSYIELFLARAGRDSSAPGAYYTLTVGDGTLSDVSPASDGRVSTLVSDMEPVGASPPAPLEYEKGDLLVRVAPEEMEYAVVRIER